MKISIKNFISAAMTASVFIAPTSALAKYPEKAIRLVVPYAPGGASDNVARLLGNQLSKVMGVPIVVENKPGAAGNIAVDQIARSKPDGYTLFMGNVSTNSINPWIYHDVIKSDARTALVPITQVASIPHIIAAAPDFPPKNLKEFVEYAKKNPGVINYGSAGTGTYAHIDMLNIADKAQIKMTHIPYDGGAGPLTLALMGNQIHVSFLNASSAIEAVRAGKLKALAVTWPERIPQMPEVETMAEAGFKGIGTNAWQGIFAPKGTPEDVINQVHAAVQKSLSDKELKDAYAAMTIFPTPSKSPADFKKFVDQETESWGNIVKKFNITIK